MSPARNSVIAASLSADGIWPWSSPSRSPCELLGREPLELLGGGARLELVGAFDERAHDVGLAPLRHLVPHALVHRGALERAGTHHLGDDRRAPGGQLAQLGLVEVAVDEHGRGARNRRRRHHQHVGRLALLAEQVALLDAEAVLLVDHRDAEARELDAAVDQRVRADQDVDVAVRAALR